MQLEIRSPKATNSLEIARIRQISQREIGFIHNPEFERMQLHEVLDDIDVSETSRTDHSRSDDDGLLNPAAEMELFRRYNYLKYKANVLRSRLTEDECASDLLHQIGELLRAIDRIRDELVNANVRLVASIARRCCRNHNDFDDFHAEASVVLLKAIEKFDYARGFRFSTYATHSIQRHLFRVLQRRQKQARRERACQEQVMASIPDRDSPVIPDEEALQRLRQLWEHSDEYLSQRDRFVLTHRFGLDKAQQSKTLREIAADIGISKERVRQIQMRALEKLRVSAEKEGLTIEA